MLTAKELTRIYGEPGLATEGRYMILWDVPQEINLALPALPNKIYCNRLLVEPLERAFRYIIARGLTAELRTWDGCYQVRKKRGGSTPSLHSWGMAVDINAAWNGFGKVPTMTPALVSCFTDAGFDWGGEWAKRDGMHFELSSEIFYDK